MRSAIILLTLLMQATCLPAQSLVSKGNGLISDGSSLMQRESSLVSNSTLIKQESTLMSSKSSLVKKKSDLLRSDENAVGAYSNVVKKSKEDAVVNVVASTVAESEVDPYVNGYGSYIEAVTSKDPLARHKFVEYISDWQWSDTELPFLAYAADRAERERQIDLCYEEAIEKFGVGTAIIATTWAAVVVVPGGTIYYTTVLIIAKATTWGAVTGAAFDGVVSGITAAANGKSSEEVLYRAINGAADGYLIGASVGIVEGVVHIAVLAKASQMVKDLWLVFGNKIYDKSGKLILDMSKASKDEIGKTIMALNKHGEEALNAIKLVYKENPKKLSIGLDYIGSKGINGVRDVLKWKGVVPDWVTKKTNKIAEAIYKSPAMKEVMEMMQLSGIRLTTKQLDMIRQHPEYLKALVEEYTGKPFKEGCLEFFIRLAKRNPKQAMEIWNYSSAVRNVIKEALRERGMHEWLLCENFMVFLIDPKWRHEGPYLAKIITLLTQNAEDVFIILEDGTVWTHTMEAAKTLGNANNPNAIIHNLIRDVIERSNSAEELLINMEKMVKENFPPEVYDKFMEGMTRCLM